MDVPKPTDPAARVDGELQRWSRIYAGEEYYYGDDAGPVARRAVRYHRPFARPGATALDTGCGEGQDLAYLVEVGYEVTGVEFTDGGAEKSRRLLRDRGLAGEVRQEDLRETLGLRGGAGLDRQFDLVLCVNVLQFLGADGLPALQALKERVSPGGVLGLSLFGRAPEQPEVRGTLWFVTLPQVLALFEGWQPMEAASLYQWNLATNEPQPFVTLIVRKSAPSGRVQGLGSRV
ncbi:MAG: class I SAM-dependent methyltransferase [Armatimonadota bacterium]